MRHGEKQITELDWSPQLADCSARVFGIGKLNSRHWEVIGVTREEFLRRGDTPSLTTVSNICELSFQELAQLLPNPNTTVYALAGVPAAHMSNDNRTKAPGSAHVEVTNVKPEKE